MLGADLTRWRTAQRARLIASRERIDRATRDAQRRTMDRIVERSFPGLARGVLAFCWPIRGEYDARHLARVLRARGAVTVLPVVVAARSPLIFREWHPGVRLAEGPMGIPYPVGSAQLQPDHVLLPMNGWDAAGYRLGYGGGYFDRTLASLAPRPHVIGVGLEEARLATIHPQPWDIAVDYVVTERGLYRRERDGLAFIGMPPETSPSALASPVCYAAELAPDYFGSAPR
jgi:5-formyltetrahydrofolate cyclo-ligase